MALNRALRLRKGSEFQRVRQQGRSIASPLLILAWAPCPGSRDIDEEKRLRIGFVVSKRISKLAVERNYIKRLLSEAIRPSLPGLSGGTDIVVSARNLTKTADLQTLKEELVSLLSRARLLDKSSLC